MSFLNTIRSRRFSGPGIAIIAFLPALSLLFTACGNGDDQGGTPPLAVTTMRVAAAPRAREFRYAGTVEGRTRVTISTKLMGEISSIPFDVGARVSAGQVLISIRSGDLKAKKAQVEAGRAEAAAALANITSNYDRIRELYARKSATQKEMDDMQMAYDVARAKSKSVEEMAKEIDDMLKYADIASPIDGTVVGKYVEEGDLASPGVPLLAVEDTRELRVNFSVPESEIAAVSTGGAVEVVVDAADPGTIIPGTVDRVNPSGDPGSRQYRVQAAIQPPPRVRLHPGMYASVSLIAAGGGSRDVNVVAIPEDLLVRRGDLDGVFIRTGDGEALLRWVRTGRRFEDGRVEILSGLGDGDEVITTSDRRIADGVRVGVSR